MQLIFTAAPRPDPGGADRALPRHPRYPGQPAELWFFSTPIIYSWRQENVLRFKLLFDLNPFTHLAISYQEILFFHGPVRPLEVAAGAGRGVGRAVPGRLLAVRPAARFVRGGGMTPAIELRNVSKIYRRYGGRQFATLKSALLQRSILRDLQSQRDVSGAVRRVVHRAAAARPSASSAATDPARARRSSSSPASPSRPAARSRSTAGSRR